ncbi:MAG: hypothetical protein IKI63_00995 [Clostridia bacterium]|nr:hypothetical protein [Clostridia bacterium]
MKRIAMAVVAVVMMLTMLMTATADNFINSVAQVGRPELQGNPEIAQGVYLILTPYAQRATLPDDGAMMDEAYNLVKSASDLTALNVDLKSLSAELGIPASDLVVSDLFDLSLIYESGGFVLDPELLAQYTPVTASVKADLLDRFVALLHYKDGEWEMIKKASVKDDEILTFTTDTLSPFAIIVRRDGTTPGGESDAPSPETGDVQPWGFAVLMAVSGLLVCLLFIRRKPAAE